MSYETITKATEDQALIARVQAAVAKESWANPDYGATELGQRVRQAGPSSALVYFMWPVAIDTEDAYEYAVDSDNPNPGGDPTVITDAALQSAVQAHWPTPPTVAVSWVPNEADPMTVDLSADRDAAWLFGDDSGDPGPKATVTHTYAAEGNFTVTATSPEGFTGSTTVSVPTQGVAVS